MTPTWEELHKEDMREFPYTVSCADCETDGSPPKFKTWHEAVEAAKKWNKEFGKPAIYKPRKRVL